LLIYLFIYSFIIILRTKLGTIADTKLFVNDNFNKKSQRPIRDVYYSSIVQTTVLVINIKRILSIPRLYELSGN